MSANAPFVRLPVAAAFTVTRATLTDGASLPIEHFLGFTIARHILAARSSPPPPEPPPDRWRRGRRFAKVAPLLTDSGVHGADPVDGFVVHELWRHGAFSADTSPAARASRPSAEGTQNVVPENQEHDCERR